MIVYHWSKQTALTETRPEFAGTGIRGAERDRQQVKGTYFGEQGYREPAVQFGRVKYRAELDTKTIYDLESDPMGLILTAQSIAAQTGRNARFEFEKLVQSHDFIGYRAQSVVKCFQPVKVEKVSENVHNF
jgi:hypothetical protein